MEPMPKISSVNPQIEENKSPSFLAKYKFTIITLCIILIALVPLLILSRHSKTTPLVTQAVPTTIPTTPTPIPLTQQNVQPTLDATTQTIQTSLNQSNQDLQAASQVDTSQDSTAGL